jgi:hypothetical protein
MNHDSKMWSALWNPENMQEDLHLESINIAPLLALLFFVIHFLYVHLLRLASGTGCDNQ